MKNVWMVAVAGAAIAVSAQAQQPVHFMDQAVASELLRGAMASQTAGVLQSSPDFARVYAASVLEQELVQEAARRGLAERLDVQRGLMQARYNILMQALREDVARHAVQPTDSEMQSLFKKEPGKWVQPESYKLDIYAVDATNSVAVDSLKAIAASQKLDEIKLKSINAAALASSTGETWVAENNIVPEVWKGVGAMKKDALQVFGVQNTVWLVRRGDYREKKPLTFDQAKPYIQQQLMGERQQAAWDAYVTKTKTALGLQ